MLIRFAPPNNISTVASGPLRNDQAQESLEAQRSMSGIQVGARRPPDLRTLSRHLVQMVLILESFLDLQKVAEAYTKVYYTTLYYTILYCTILYYTILYYTILYYTLLYYTTYHIYHTIKADGGVPTWRICQSEPVKPDVGVEQNQDDIWVVIKMGG